MRIKATEVKASELNPGDLFSTAGQIYWDMHSLKESVGERVFIRTEAPCPPDQAQELVFRIEIER